MSKPDEAADMQRQHDRQRQEVSEAQALSAAREFVRNHESLLRMLDANHAPSMTLILTQDSSKQEEE